jgi:peptidoglycan hydrolase-like protein with peptidoglycan-binding domain
MLGIVWRAALALALLLCGRFARRPVDSMAILVALGASAVIVVNAAFLQSGSHPAPFFAHPARPLVANEPPRPKPSAPVARTQMDIIADIQLELTRRGFYEGPVDGTYGPKTDAAIREFEQGANLKAGTDPSESLLAAINRSQVRVAPGSNRTAPWRNDPIADLIGPSRRIMALQRALSDFGYGQINPTGTLDEQTSRAIEKFERERRLPITGQVSERLLREVAALTGRPLE